jgi:hypothetical protein
MGPSGLDRRTAAVRSSVRSHPIVGSQPTDSRRHRCRPPALSGWKMTSPAASAGPIPSMGVAVQRIWLV